ncbi:hypothetical protein [Amycolatopsis sp. NPDC004169]|uniref:hypothetical protein n=1 Tax=Amycolatopsis sp. NPDC004169 TaxID=3154453 RepID=UPI0033BA6B0E
MRAENGHDVLRLLYEAVGSPGYQDLVDAADRKGTVLSKGTISNLLSGKTEPRRRTVLIFVESCLTHSPRARTSALFRELPAEARDTAYWVGRWDKVTGKPARVPAPAGWDFFIVCRRPDAPAAQRLTELLQPRARVCGSVALAPDTPRQEFEQQHRASAVTVVLVPEAGLGEIRSSVEVAADLVRRDPDSHVVVSVPLDGAPTLPEELAGTEVLDDALPVVAERLLKLLAVRQRRPAAGSAELAATTVGLLSAIDDHLLGRASRHGPVVEALLADFGDPAFDERARRYGLQAALILREAENHGDAVRHWTRDDDGTAALALDRFRDHLAEAIAAGHFPLPSALAEQVAATVRGEAPGQHLLPGFTPPVRSTSDEVVVAEKAQLESFHTTLDERGRRLTPAARQMCVLPAVDQRFRGRDRLLDAVPAASVVWLSGAPGTGTSAVAVHRAHQVADEFETVLYLDLHGMTPESRRSARTAARILLDALGERMVADLREDAALYERLAASLRRRKTLLVLDNARDADHVAPIVRAGGAETTLITSRLRVQSFTEHTVQVPALDRKASIELLDSYAAGIAEDLLDRLAELCDDLPLALRLIAARLGDPDLPPDEIARLLAAERTRLDLLQAGDRAVRAAIVFTYRDLKPLARRAARYLSIGFGSVSDAGEMAAGLADFEDRTSLALHRVVDANLARCARGPNGPMRFRMTPLIRLAMRERSAKEDRSSDIADYQQRVARYLADQLVAIVGRTGGDPELEVDPTRAHAALTAAVAGGWWSTVLDVGENLRAIHESEFDLDGVDATTTELVKAHLAMGEPKKAVRAAKGAAVDLRSSAQHRSSALSWAQKSVELARVHDVAGEQVGCCLLCAGIAFELEDKEKATEYSRMAVELSEGTVAGAIRPLVNLGKLLADAGDREEAAGTLRRAVDLADLAGSIDDRAAAHFEFAAALSRLGRSAEAAAAWARSAELYVAENEWMNAAIAKENEAGVSAEPEAVAALTDAVAKFRKADEPARALAALCHLSASVFRTTQAAEKALQVLDEAHDITPGEPDLAYEVEVRKTCLRAILRRLANLPEGTPPRRLAEHDAYRNARDALRHGNDPEALLRFVLHPVIETPKHPDPWVFEEPGRHDRRLEIG